MERIFWVKNGELSNVNEWLSKYGGRVKTITPVCENIAAYSHAGGESSDYDKGYYVGDIYAYVVVEIGS